MRHRTVASLHLWIRWMAFWPGKEEGLAMVRTIRKLLAILTVVTVAVTFTAPPVLAGVGDLVIDEASADAMIADLVFLRPAGLVALIGGSVVFVVSLPFSALGGNVGEAAQKLVVDPARYTFVRPLGHMEGY
jgi:hypothetical protein